MDSLLAASCKVLAIIYVGVTVSDMVTFAVGVALRHGLFNTLKKSLFRCQRPAVSISICMLRPLHQATTTRGGSAA